MCVSCSAAPSVVLSPNPTLLRVQPLVKKCSAMSRNFVLPSGFSPFSFPNLNLIRSKMGILESGGIYLHPVCRHPQEPGSTHIQSEVGQPGPVDLRTNPGSVSVLMLSFTNFLRCSCYINKPSPHLTVSLSSLAINVARTLKDHHFGSFNLKLQHFVCLHCRFKSTAG